MRGLFMIYMNGEITNNYTPYSQFKNFDGQEVTICGHIHRIREMTGFSFVIIRTANQTIQCVYAPEFSQYRWDEKLCEEACVKVVGKVVGSKDAKGNERFELQIHNIEILSLPAAPLPIVINKKQLDNIQLNTILDLRPVSMRNPKERAIFKVQEGIARGFREFLMQQNFTEIRSPKINYAGAEGGTNVFKLDYFGKQVFLAQSPQLYKQALVGVFNRVFEVAPVFRAEHHDTSRQLNEYTSMDFEMGFINGFEDIMNMETGVLKYIMNLLKAEYQEELELLHADVPEITSIPTIKFMEAKELLMTKFKYKPSDMKDFDPEEESLLGKYAKKELNSDFIFVTHYPSKKRPFYTMDDPNETEYTLSFDLLF